MAKTKEIKLPSLLSFERKLEVSDALMFSGNWAAEDKEDNWSSIPITPRKNRGTKSMCKLPKGDDRSDPNLVEGDDANLLNNHDTLKVHFTLRTIGNVGEPFACNESDFEEIFRQQIGKGKEDSLLELAHRYAHNIASGRFLWRNRVNAEKVQVIVKLKNDEIIQFDNSFDFSFNDFDSQRKNTDLNKLAQVIFDGLNSKKEDNKFVLVDVTAFVLLGQGQHVFPSQEMNMGEKKKVLFKLHGCAAMHSVKIGNAIRTVDNWYKPDAEFPIAAEPFGAVTQKGQAYRKTNNDLYTLIESLVNEKPITDDERCFILANLIRGGVFSGESKKKGNS